MISFNIKFVLLTLIINVDMTMDKFLQVLDYLQRKKILKRKAETKVS